MHQCSDMCKFSLPDLSTLQLSLKSGIDTDTIEIRSTPAYGSPLRHHHRNHSKPRQVKETLHARSEYTNSEDDGGAVHRINQYIIKQEIGRGSFGAVHLAVDQHGQEYVRSLMTVTFSTQELRICSETFDLGIVLMTVT